MKCSMLSESCVNVGRGIHLQLAPAQADHDTSAYGTTLLLPSHLLLSLPPYALHRRPLTYSVTMEFFPLTPTSRPCTRACATSFQRRSTIYEMVSEKKKRWSAVQRVGSSGSVNMDDWTQPEGKCECLKQRLDGSANTSTWMVLIKAQHKHGFKTAAHIRPSARAQKTSYTCSRAPPHTLADVIHTHAKATITAILKRQKRTQAIQHIQ